MGVGNEVFNFIK